MTGLPMADTSTHPSRHGQQRLAFLDSLRGLAAVYVLLFHMVLIPTPHLQLPRWANGFIMTGGTGVTLFFIVSAFSMCYSMADPNARLGSFYARRFFRIAPLFYAMIVFYLIRDRVYFQNTHSLFEVMASVLFIFNLIPGRETGFVWASWTIGVEVLFYLVFPLVHARLKTIPALLAAFLGSLLFAALFKELLISTSLAPAVRDSYVSYSLLHHLPVFLYGMLVYRLYDEWIAGQEVPASWGYAAVSLAIYAYYSLLQGALTGWFVDAYFWQAVVYGCLVIGLAIHPSWLMVNPVTTFLGQISYSVYLVHPSVIFFLGPAYRRIEATAMPRTASFLLSAALTLAIVIGISVATNRLIEQPGMRLGKRVAAWFGGAGRPAPA